MIRQSFAGFPTGRSKTWLGKNKNPEMKLP